MSILGSIGLFAAFIALTRYEAVQGSRFGEQRRAVLDRKVGRLAFIVAHVDFGAFVREESRRIVAQGGHALAHFSLRGVRAAERLLTRAVRHLRATHAVPARPPAETREFVRTLTDFKGRLKDTMPEAVPVERQD